MNRLFFIGFFFILLTFRCQAQSVYSKENLEKATEEELNHYLQKAKNTKTAGAILSITGPIIAVTGGVIMNNNFSFTEGNGDKANTGGVLLLTGVCATIVGLPLLINGSSRVKKIKEIKNTAFNGVEFDLAPCNFYDYQTHNHQFGVTLKVSY
jgi:hypothetical protein